MELAPIVIFLYRRVDNLQKLLSSLLQNPEASRSPLILFCDGPKNALEKKETDLVFESIQNIGGFRSVSIHRSEVNRGLANSIIAGVTQVFQEYDRIIVLEDDLEVSNNFLAFMNQSLNLYEDEQEVFSIGGYSFPFDRKDDDEVDGYFLNRSWPWSWATWKNRWEKIDWGVSDYENFKNNRTERKEFARLGSDVNAMLDKQMRGELDSWAIRWVYHQFKIQGLSYFPKISKVKNNGFDALATHTKGSNKRYLTNLDETNKRQFKFPAAIKLDEFYQKEFLKTMSIPRRILSRLTSEWIALKRRFNG
jgi:hypothetical protein